MLLTQGELDLWVATKMGHKTMEMRTARKRGAPFNQELGVRKMAAVGLSHYNIKAPLKQLEELRDFYCKIVGLVEGPRPPFKRFGYWLYANDQAILHLIAAQNDKDPDTTTSTTIDHVAFACTDFHEMKDKLDSNGVSYSFAEVPKRNQRQLFLKDPAGNGVELIFELEPPPKNT